jgi:hypothetical protein
MTSDPVAARIEVIIDKRVVAGTRKSYESSMRGFTSWLYTAAHPQLIRDNNIDLPALGLAQFQQFLAFRLDTDGLSLSAYPCVFCSRTLPLPVPSSDFIFNIMPSLNNMMNIMIFTCFLIFL